MADWIRRPDAADREREYDRLLEDHATIRRWVRRHGGQPVVETTPLGIERLAVRFPDDATDDATAIPWAEFFAHFEAKELALACSEGSGVKCELVDRASVD